MSPRRDLDEMPGSGKKAVVGSVVFTHVFNLPQYGIATVGDIHLAAPSYDWSVLASIDWFQLAQMSLALVLIVYAESYSVIRSHALQQGDVMRPNRDLAALGLVNTVSAFGGGLAVGAAPSAHGLVGRIKWCRRLE